MSLPSKTIEDYLEGKRPILPEKLCELIELLNVSSKEKSYILNSNLVIEVSISKKPKLALTILGLLSEKNTQVEGTKAKDDYKSNFSLTLFYIASVLPELEGNIEKISKFLSIEVSVANKMATKLRKAGILMKSDLGEIKAKYSWIYLEKLIQGDLDQLGHY